MTTPRRYVLCSSITLLLGITGLVCAQQTPPVTAELTGVVADEAGAVIPGVMVSATNTQTGVTSTTISNETGNYRFRSLGAGTYRLNADLPGFRTQSYTSVPFAAAMRSRLNFVLEPGEGTASSATAPITPLPPQEIAAPPAQTVNRVRVAGRVMASNLLQMVSPVYPQQAREEKIEGVVVLEVQIDRMGFVSASKIISGHPALTQAAIDAVKQWAYRPTMLNNQPIDVTSTVSVNFTLSR